jgi:6-phosphogluconolactonase
MSTSRSRALGLFAALALVALGALAGPAGADGRSEPGTVYTSTNGASGNAILAFHRTAGGGLSLAGAFATGGTGTGGGLGNQGAVVLADHLLFAVNAGSDQVTSFRVTRRGLRRVDIAGSGGDQPVSVTVHDGLLYVLNAGSDDISGLRVGQSGDLSPLAGSTRDLSGAGTGPAQVEFTPDGHQIVVTEKATNQIDTFAVAPNGLAGPANVQDSVGQTPFGFAFDKRGHLIVSEAFGSATDASALSSYDLAPGGTLTPISPSVGTGQTAACWVVVTKNGRFAYTTNTGSGSISSYDVGRDGSIALLEGRAADTGAGSSPTDLALSESSRHLFVLNSAAQTVGSFRVGGDGRLDAVDVVGGLPAGATGLAAS